MKKSLKRFGFGLILATAGCIGVGMSARSPMAHGQPADAVDPPQTVAVVEELKADAVKSILDGQFDQTNKLLGKAASVSADPHIAQMAEWSSEFETQREQFAAERQKQFEKNVDDVHKLLDHNMPDYAIDAVAAAYLRAADKKAFRNEKWVDDLVQSATDSAAKYEANEQWLKALRIYSDLTSVDPTTAEWKSKLKLVTRRIRLLMLYTPDQLKAIQASEAKERKAADELLRPPATQPVADATTKPTEEDNENFKVDWHETVRGIRFDMLWDSLVHAQADYYREVTYAKLMNGGITGLRTLVTTQGLDKAFPNLGEPGKRDAFTAALDEVQADVKDAADLSRDSQELVMQKGLNKLLEVNHQSIDLPDEVFVSEFADGAFAELDPFSSMIWPYDVEEFNKTTQGEFSGVGIQIQSDEDGSLRVVSPLEDSPAYKAGIKAGDIVTHINGKNAHGISLNQAVKTITGPPHTVVTLTVRSPDGASKDFPIERETIKVASVKGYQHKPGGGWDYFVDPSNKIAYLRLTNFTKTTGEELDKTIDELRGEGAQSIVLDLRYNPGGLLNAATEVADKFLRDGVIVSTHPDRKTENLPTVASAKPDDDEWAKPLVVLVNQYSASASEIVSGALKDHKRAIIVGERTFGKGSVQMLFPIDGKKAFLKLTTSHYYLPSGRCLHREENSTEWGVDPDVTIEMTPEQMRAAIDARQDMDVLRDADDGAPAPSATPSTQPAKKDLLAADPQLAAALLVLRLEGAGAKF